MNGSIQPTVELATANNGYAYPVMPYGNGFGSGFGFGGDGIWAIVLIALLFGNNGFGGWGNNGYNNIATTDYISSEFTQRDINNGFQNQSNLIANGFSDNATNICNLRSEVLENRYANQLAECTTQRDILTQTNELNTNLLTTQLNAQAQLDKCCCDLRAEGLANTQKILDTINNNTIQDLRDRLAAAENKLSDDNVINSVLPRSIPAYITASPYQSIFPYGFNGGFYGNGFYGNTIV